MPASSQLFPSAGAGPFILVSGINGVSLGSSQIAPGVVLASVSDPAFFGGIEFVAANASAPAPAAGRPDRISPRALRELGW